MNTSIYFAPLQSFTTLPYYLSFHELIGGVDKYFTPFYRADKEGSFVIEPQLTARSNIHIVPQVLTNRAGELLLFAREVGDKGFGEINLNVGCPFPMVVNRKLGSGLLPYPDDLRRMLSVYFDQDIPMKLSLKLRLGLADDQEVYAIMDVLKDFALEEIIMHPRLGIQKYKGVPNWTLYGELSQQYHLVGNGDITSKDRLEELQHMFSNTHAWMIGRGLLTNPCMLNPNLNWHDTIIKLHDLFLHHLREFGLSEHQILNQLKCFWEYPALYIEGGQRVLRKMKKVGSFEAYTEAKHRLLG